MYYAYILVKAISRNNSDMNIYYVCVYVYVTCKVYVPNNRILLHIGITNITSSLGQLQRIRGNASGGGT